VSFKLTASNTPKLAGPFKKAVRMRKPLQKPEQRGFSVNETTHITNLSRPTVYRLIGSGKLKSVKILGRRIILAEGVDELLREGAE
jgi:excisionase family DNA binding protein